MKHRHLLPLAFFLFLPGCAEQAPSAKREAPPVTAAAAPATIDASQLKMAMDDGADYLARATKPSGEFVYLDSLDSKKTFKPVYNVLRHAGAMYAMSDYYAYKPDPKVKSALIRAAKWLQKKYIQPVKGVPNVLAVWSLPSDRAGDGALEIKLGGVGLGLVGLVGTEKVARGTTPLETLRKLGNCLLWMQEDDGSFFSKYDPANGGKNNKWESLYYPGEAALALAMLAEHDPDPKIKKRWINAAFRAVGFMAQSRKGTAKIPADHWILIATARLWPLYASSDRKISRQILLRHAVQICNVIATDSALRDVRTTPIATRVEGMLAAMTFLPPDQKELRLKMQGEIETGVLFLMKTQSKTTGPMKGAIPRAFTAAGSTPVEERAGEVRIDYIQHALSAWLEYSRQSGIIKKS